MGATGGVYCGSRMEYEYGDDEEGSSGQACVEELNCTFADRRSLGRYLFFGQTGIYEYDFHRISNSQNRPLFMLARKSPDPNAPIYANAIGRFPHE